MSKSNMPFQEDMSLQCEFKNGRIVLEIGSKILGHATDINPDFYDDELDRGKFQVVDHAVFAKEVVNYLNQEDEEGSSLVTEMLDKAITLAIENGAEGVEETS